MIKRPLALFLFLFVLGEIIVRLLISNILWIIPVTLTAGLIIRRGRKYMTGEIRVIYFLLFFGLLLGAGHGVLYSCLRYREVSSFKRMGDTEVICSGEIISLKEGDGYKSYVIKTKEGKVIFYLKDGDAYISSEGCSKGEDCYIKGEGSYINGEGKDGSKDYKILPGDQINLKGQLEEIKKASNPGGFDKNSYYKSKGIDFLIKGKVIEIKRRNSLRKILYGIKMDMKEALYLILPKKKAGLLSSMLLGDKEDIDREEYIIYQMNGMAHMLAISGLHVSLVAEAFFFFFMLLCRRRRAAAGLTIIFIVLYGSITGFAEATSRAVIMMTVIMGGRFFSSAADSVTSLFLALFINIIINPYAIYSPGFIMSYLAVAGVLVSQVFYKLIFKNERFLMVPLRLRKYIKYLIKAGLMGIILNAVMLPVMLNNYYGIPVFSLLINMLLVPLLSIALVSGFTGVGIYLLIIRLISVLGGGADVISVLGAGANAASVSGVGANAASVSGVGANAGWLRFICSIIVLPAKWVLNIYEAVGRFIIKLPGSYITTGHIGTAGVVIICVIFYIITVFIYHALKYHTFHHHSLRKQVFHHHSLRNQVFHHHSLRKQVFHHHSLWNQVFHQQVFRHRRHKHRSEKIGNDKRREYVITLSIYILMMIISVGTVKIINQCRECVLFLDVGQGDCCIVHTRSSGNYIFDAGSSSVKDVGYRTLIPALKYYGIDKIDVIFVSHTDEDHINGIIELINLSDIEKIKIKNIAFAKGTAEDKNMKTVLSWLDTKESKEDHSTKIIYLNAGDVISKGELSINILYPFKDKKSIEDEKTMKTGEYGRDMVKKDKYEKHDQRQLFNGLVENSGNDYSLVAELRYKKMEAIFTGDISSYVEEKLVKQSIGKKEDSDVEDKKGKEDSDVKDRKGKEESDVEDKKEKEDVLRILKVPHHGSKYSSSEAFLKSVDCDIAIISAGENNLYGHPHKETLERLEEAGCKVYRTDKDGAIIIEE